jgi:anti-sigma28 factor (negative regulator of flagellin synthesis)
MRINGSNFDPIRPDRPATAPASPEKGRSTNSSSVQPSGADSARSDSVQISSAGRHLAASAELDPERTAELRTQVLTGAYNTLDIVDQVARRMLSRGDL